MRWFKIILVIYLLCCLGLFFVQEKVIFAAHPYPNEVRYSQGHEVEIPLEENLTMNAVILPATTSNKKSEGAILYLHGNKGNVRRGIYQTRRMSDKGLDIMVVDYRSYGKTEGKPINDKQMLEDADKAYQYLKENYAEKNLYIVGYSLGTGMASYIAQKNNPAHLVLIAPFTSLVDIKDKYLWMFPDFLLKYKLDNAKHLKAGSTPTTILHGTNDDVVSYEYGVQLAEANKHVSLVTSQDQSHRGIIFDPMLSKILDNIIK